jgi:syntaxin 18
MLSNVRAPYLNLSAASSSRPRITPSDADLLNWKNVQSLTNDERDQIDSQAKQLLSKCSDRVREMERLVKGTPLLIPQTRSDL